MNNLPLEHRARRAAKRVGLVARKSHRRTLDSENYGAFMLLNETANVVVGGARYEMSAEEVIDYCRQLEAEEARDDRP